MAAKLHLLGTPSLVIDGGAARWHSAKILALLAYLVLEAGKGHRREKLATLLWGDSPEVQARASLRQGLYSLRKTLGPLAGTCLVLEAGTVGFRPHLDLWVDVLELQTLLDAGDAIDLERLRHAAQLYRGALLDGLPLTACPGFEEWLFFRRDFLEQQAIRTYQSLIEHLVQQNMLQEALSVAQRLISLEPLHERAYQQLLQIHAALGDRDGLRHHYRLCVEILARELGVEPSSETQALYHQLSLAAAVAPISTRPEAPLGESQPPLELPFLGRERELALLQARLHQACTGHGGLVLVSGESGIGKTRLIHEWQRITGAEEPHGAVRWLAGRCYAAEARAPYSMWSDALHPLSTSDWQPLVADLGLIWRQQLARLLPDLESAAGEVEGMTVAESRLRLLQGVVQCLVKVTQTAPLVLFFDDLQWADEDSIALLHYAVRHLKTAPLIIVIAFRSEMTADNPLLAQLVRAEGDAVPPMRLRLMPLSQEITGHLLMHMRASVSPAISQRLQQHSEGNPFVLVETLRTLIDDGTSEHRADGRLIVRDVPVLPMPRRVYELIQARVAVLTEVQHRIVAAAAVIGRPFSLQLLRRVSGLPEPRLLQELDHLVARAVLSECEAALLEQSLAFTHEYFRRIIYEDLGSGQRQALHRRVAEALLALHRAHPHLNSEAVATHFESAGDARAVTHLMHAAMQAEALFAYGHAADLYSRAVAFHRRCQDNDPTNLFELLLAREALYDRQGRRAEQAEDLAALVSLAEALGDPARLAAVYKRQAGYFTYTHRYDEAQCVGEKTLALYRERADRRGEAQALRELGFIHWSASNYGQALLYGRQALQLHRVLGDGGAEATALHNLAEIFRGLGSPRQALQLYAQALELQWAVKDERWQGLTLYGMAHALRQMGEPQAAMARYQQAMTLCLAAGDRLMVSRIHQALASILWEHGPSDQVLEHLNQALGISQDIGYGPGIAHGFSTLGAFAAQRGERNMARRHFEDASTWLGLTEDQDGLIEVQSRLQSIMLEPCPMNAEPPAMGWVKSHLALAEGKVYCEFESPLARSRR